MSTDFFEIKPEELPEIVNSMGEKEAKRCLISAYARIIAFKPEIEKLEREIDYLDEFRIVSIEKIKELATNCARLEAREQHRLFDKLILLKTKAEMKKNKTIKTKTTWEKIMNWLGL